MGIQGLTTYIYTNRSLFLEPFELHDTYIVIDGNSLASQLYLKQSNTNCFFGGDYDKFAQNVSEFFDNFTKCNVTSLVLLDGGYEEGKIPSARKRIKDRVSTAFRFNQTTLNKRKFTPLFLKVVLKEVMSKKGIKFIQTTFEADNHIASIARILNCPVLSFDSDFYIYDVKYISFNTLSRHPIKKIDEKEVEYYVRNCSMYTVEYFLKQFEGLNRLHLPLASILLGNDYIDSRISKKLFQQLILVKPTNSDNVDSQENSEEGESRIGAMFKWLSNFTVNAAISQILENVPEESQKVLEVIEMLINFYTHVDPQMMIHLGFSEEFVSEARKKLRNIVFKFTLDNNNLYSEEESKEGVEIKTDEQDLESKVDDDIKHELNLEKVAPDWFIQDFHSGRFASYFIDIFIRNCFVCPAQIEDCSCPAAAKISTKILSVIYGLLTKHLQGPKSLTCLYREQGKEIITSYLDPAEYDFPNLFELRNLPITVRQKILEDTLGIPDSGLDCFPDEWKLYVATIIFWMTQQKDVGQINCYLYSLLFGMFFDIVDKKIGFYRKSGDFIEQYDHLVRDAILTNPQNKPNLMKLNHNVTIGEALSQVTDEDCVLVAPFFLKYFKTSLLFNCDIKPFDVSIVHGFAQFQICLWHNLHLNALLGLPYQQTTISEMFNGTLLYNLVDAFKMLKDVDFIVSYQLQNSPSLLTLFNVLLSNIKGLLKPDLLKKMAASVNSIEESRNFTAYENVYELSSMLK